MKNIKVESVLYFIVFFFLPSICALLDINESKITLKQQKHIVTLQSRRLYLSKSLSSREDITLPFQRIFSISSTLPSSIHSNSLINFSPTTVKLSPSKYSTLIEFDQKISKSDQPLFGKQILEPHAVSLNESILNDLRTPFPHQVLEIVVLNQKLIFLFVFPAKVIVLQQMTNLLAVKNIYQVEEFKEKFDESNRQASEHQFLSPERISFYPFSDSYVIGYLQESHEFFLFDEKGYKILENEAKITTLEHLHTFDAKDLEFFTAERQNGFKHCRLNLTSNKIQLIKKFQKTTELNLNLANIDSNGNDNILQIYDISFDLDQSEIYLLDNNLGVIKFKYGAQKTENNQIIPKTTSLIIHQRGCQALDYIPNDRIFLICQERKRRFFIEAYLNRSFLKFEKQPPVFHNCNFEDLQITKEYYIAFEQSSIDIFWPSKNNFIPELVHNKKHINLLGMQAFKIHSNKNGEVYLYSVRNNMLIKEKLQEEKYSLSVGSAVPIRKSFAIQVFGNCQQLYFNLNQNKKYSVHFTSNQISRLNQQISSKFKNRQNQLCKIRIPIQLQTSRYIFENRGKFSLAIGILVICVLIAFTLICICMKKYLGMQKTAQQTLNQLQRGQKVNPQFVL